MTEVRSDVSIFWDTDSTASKSSRLADWQHLGNDPIGGRLEGDGTRKAATWLLKAGCHICWCHSPITRMYDGHIMTYLRLSRCTPANMRARGFTHCIMGFHHNPIPIARAKKIPYKSSHREHPISSLAPKKSSSLWTFIRWLLATIPINIAKIQKKNHT